ncbi:GH36-type glycosyl hydrolase domain-containing protein [Burkholderiaceae bacterium UC74_6]
MLAAHAEDAALLKASAGPLDPPVRAVLFGPARFEQHGQSLARTHEVVGGTRSNTRFFPRLQSNIEMLRRSRAQLERRVAEGRHLGPAAHWLLDNATLIDEQVHAIRRGLPRSFFRLLPRLRDEPLAGLPRIYGVAWAWVAHTDSGFDAALLHSYLSAYQAERALSLAELWALPTTLRVVLIENLRRLAERSATQQAARDAAHHWFDQAPEDRAALAELEALEPGIRARGVEQAFYLQLEHRQDELPPEMAAALDTWLNPRLPDPAGTLARQQNESTEDQQSVRNAIVTLRQLDRVDWRKLIGASCAVMRILQEAPVYAAESEQTQDETLHAVERLARRSGQAEATVAEVLVELTRTGTPDGDAHGAAPAYWWRGAGRPRLFDQLGLPTPPPLLEDGSARRAVVTLAYLSGLAGFSFWSAAWLLGRQASVFAPGWLLLLTALLLLGPASEAVVAFVNRLISESARPRRLPSLALVQGLSAEERTLVVLPVMLGSEAEIEALAAQLEQHHLANPEAHCQFALLSDYRDADASTQDSDAALLGSARRLLAELNLRYPQEQQQEPQPGLRFLLLHREREWSESEQRWMGWERKRGKLEQLIALLAEPTARSSPFNDLGALSQPAEGTRYVVTLDADTDMPPGRLRALVGTAAHPLNQPRIDTLRRRVLSGYAVLQPRVSTPLPDPASSTPFQRLFSGQGGIDPYSAATSEIYQDLFGEGTFTGKGLLNVHALHAVLSQRLPPSQVLSHDLLEGSIARCAGLSEVTLMEEQPAHPDVAAARQHRWTRGDWQLLPFVARASRYGIAPINRWKMIDNLRRSLVGPCSLLLLLLVLATGVLPPGWALLVVAAAFSAGPLLGAVAGLAPNRDDIALRHFYHHAFADVLRALMLAVWQGAQLLQSSLMHTDAIVRALYRQWVSHRDLLEWTTAAQATAAAQTELPALIHQHRRVAVAALVILLGLIGCEALLGTDVQWPYAVPLLLVWAASPLWTWLACRPRRRPPKDQLDADGKLYLQDLARETWRYYEQHIGPEDHHLPPDNVQLSPQLMVAHRTSPTNIGLYLLSVSCARELGFIGAATMADRLQATLDTMDQLPRWHGHFYNWLDTRTLTVLQPAYVSSVDSGNCSVHLLAVARACEIAARSIALDQAPKRLGPALAQTMQRLRVLRPVLSSAPDLQGLWSLVDGQWTWPENLPQAQVLQQRVAQARRELDALHQRLSSAGVERGALWMLGDMVGSLESALRDRLEDAEGLRKRLLSLAARARKFALDADFTVLYDRERRLLHIGWRFDAQMQPAQVDENHYDLLASEARLTSLLAIAKGDAPVEHWGALGRPFFAEGKEVGLKSWSGSMFEYLMPSLVLDEPHGSVLGQMGRSAVAEQRRDGSEHATPWGISESAIASRDHTLAYQYGPQGAARLALRRTPAGERVLAPYATALAALVAPCAAVSNLQALQALGARQALGFVEALDYTPVRQSQDQATGRGFTLVDTFMTHHQSMILVAITNLLADNAPRRWTMGDPHLRAVTDLLHERAPREVARLAAAVPAQPRSPRAMRLVRETQPLSAPGLPLTHLLTNGRHAVMLRHDGSGSSCWKGVGLNRWRDDLLRGEFGHFFYLQREGAAPPASPDAPWHSITAHPAPDRSAKYDCTMLTDRVVFEARWPDLLARCTTWVSPEDDCELRQIELCNLADQPLGLRLAAVIEATLAPQRADESHPAFSNMFLQQRWNAADRALFIERRPRLPDEPVVRAVHFLATAEGQIESLTPCADRARWIGRYGSAAQPLGDAGCELAEDGVLNNGLDPLSGLIARLQLPPGATLKLTFCLAASNDAGALEALIDKYQQPTHIERAANMSHTMAGIRVRELQFDAETWSAMLTLNTFVTALASRAGIGALRSPLPANARCDRRLLWQRGISGDRPLVWIAISGEEGLELVLALKKALRWWTAAGLGVDLVVTNGEPHSYLSPVQHQLLALQARQQAQAHHDLPEHLRCKLHVVREQEIGVDERQTLQTLARIKLLADGRSLAQQIERLLEDTELPPAGPEAFVRQPWRPANTGNSRRWPTVLPQASRVQAHAAATEPEPPQGRFEARDGSYAFELSPERRPSRPWINVLANPHFGCQVSELGSGYVWAGNSRMHQVTAWSNDPLSDPPGEWLLLQDLERGRVWTLGRQLSAASASAVEHGIGSTRITQHLDGLDVTLTFCVDEKAAIKQVQIKLNSSAPRRLRLVAMVEWQMGSARQERLSINTRPRWFNTSPDGAGLPQPAQALALQCTQLDHLGGFGGATGFVTLRPDDPDTCQLLDNDWTCDRREFFEPAGQLVLPALLGRRSGPGLDACGALAAVLTPGPDAEAGLTVLLGHGPDAETAQQLLIDAWELDPSRRLMRQQAHWDECLGAVRVRTPDARFDALMNRWLPYQTLACRIWARAGFYQAGGAFGYRDQLQDAMALVTHSPQLLAEQLRRSAAHQFPEGDVQHWWHEPGGAGVRTHFSDDRLWLPYALAHYCRRTGDIALLDEQQPFLAGQQVPPGAEDIYETPGITDERASIYEHAARAIDRSLSNGAHGLPLFGTGDWNDGMNRVGSGGRGESVWLAWFLCRVVDDFLPFAKARGDTTRVRSWQAARLAWAQALDAQAWDGRWYMRGFFDDGTPLGSSRQTECRIDLIAQAWAVLSGAGERPHAREAMASVIMHLFDRTHQLVHLLDPPLQHAKPYAGYIQSYPPGVRENGGQYNHAAVWALMALAQLGQRAAMWQVFTALSPAHRWMEPQRGATYAIEPYVMAGDVYTAPPYTGRGGWSWYTGSAGWLLRAGVESICGVTLSEGRLHLRPCLPPHWPSAEVTLRHEGQNHRVIVCADQQTLDAMLAEEPMALLATVGELIELDRWPQGSVHAVLASAPSSATLPPSRRPVLFEQGKPDLI